MDLILRLEEKLRFQNWNAEVFADADCNTHQYGIGITFYDMHHIQIRKKSNTFKAFVIPPKFPIDEYDFGYWSDAEVIWQSF